MKKLFFYVTLLSSTAFGQMTQSNEPAYAASKMMYVCDSNAVTYSSLTGSNQVWDYSQLPGVGSLTQNVSLDTIDVTTIDTTFIGATKKYSIGTNLSTFYNSSSSDRISQGFIFTDATLGSFTVNWDVDDEKLAYYPFALSNFLNDNFSGTVNTSATGTTTATGTCYATVDGTGTLKLQQNTYNNITRYHVKDSTTTTVFGATISLVRDWYEYYDLSGGNYLPLFILINLKVASPFVNNQTSLVLSSDQPNVFVGLNELNSSKLTVYPNPSNDLIHIQSDKSIDKTVIYDVSGKVMGTYFQNEISVSHYATGLYIIETTDHQGYLTKTTFMKN